MVEISGLLRLQQQSGFQPTVEPTGFQPVVVQFPGLDTGSLSMLCQIFSEFL